ncbi:hypothetical protein J4711_14955 [Staphylococcus epidermidis]|nr:hypothetical protein [Staphylococcus epidermidis]
MLPAEWLDASFLAAAMRKVTSGPALRESLVRYGEPMGDSSLREALARRLRCIGIAAVPGQIITTMGPRRRWTLSAVPCCSPVTR